MNINMNNISAGDLISAFALLIAGIGLFLNFLQLRKNSTRNRAEFILQYFNQYLADTDAVEMFYKIDYDIFKYNPQSFHGSVTERKLDKLLMYFDRISLLYEMGIVTLDDLKLVKYEFVAIANNWAIQNYLKAIENPDADIIPYSALKKVSGLLKNTR